ncbi:MAG: Rrf2 family transcriptional regulator [Labilithrix sp.]|nr:Rrf2 family transcriptional regulator [Labilithrix sp.]
MLRLSNRGRYALKAVFDLAVHGDAPVQVRDVATRQRIPLRFLEQIFQLLKRGGLVESKRGPRGGFTLAREPDEVKLGDVLRAVEGPVVLTGSPAGRRVRRGAAEEGEPRDVTEAVLADLSRSVEQCFDGITVQDLCARGERAAIARRARAASAPYVI